MAVMAGGGLPGPGVNGAVAAAQTPAPGTPKAQAQHRGAGDRDARPGRRDASAQQRALAAKQRVSARWNRLGTPAGLAPQGTALATGLPADPVTAARTYLAQHRDLLG